MSAGTKALVLIGLFSALYFVDTCIRAAFTSFWYDELLTYYIARLPTFHAAWLSILHGADLTPPLFDAIQRLDGRIFGDGLIGLRLPEIVGFWIFCVCLFRFVSKDAGLLAGWAAMCLPLFTGAYFYAYEARAYAIVLGFCGLALIAWQNWEENRNSARWLMAFTLSIACAGLIHSLALLIAVPFAVTEIFSSIESRRIYWKFWLALGISAGLIAISTLPLVEGLRHLDGGNNALYILCCPASPTALSQYYLQLLSHSPVFLLLALAVAAFPGSAPEPQTQLKPWNQMRINRGRLILTVGFLLLPEFAAVFSRAAGSRFIMRYFISALAGVSLAFGYAVAKCRRRWLAAALAAALTLAIAGDFARFFLHRNADWNALAAPAVPVPVSATPGKPLAVHPLLSSVWQDSKPIAVPVALDFLYLVRYAPALVQRLYPVSIRTADISYLENRATREAGLVACNHEQTFAQFLPTHPDFYLYGEPSNSTELVYVVSAGGEIKSLQRDAFGHFLAEIHMHAKR